MVRGSEVVGKAKEKIFHNYEAWRTVLTFRCLLTLRKSANVTHEGCILEQQARMVMLMVSAQSQGLMDISG